MGRQSGNLHLLMDSLIQLGRVELALGRPVDAKASFEAAIAAFVALETAHSNRIGAALLGLGWTAFATGIMPRQSSSFGKRWRRVAVQPGKPWPPTPAWRRSWRQRAGSRLPSSGAPLC